MNEVVGRILLVEDEQYVQKLHRLFLEKLSFHVDAVTSGYEAINRDHKYYEAILLDIGLPDFNGITVCSKIREQYSPRELPIIGITAHGKEIEQECLAAGMNEILQKPISFNILNSALERWLNCKL